jgi:hypothetical protein
MKKIKISGLLAFIMIVVVVTAINVNISFQKKGLSDISLANLEVLAQNETDGSDMEICCDDEYTNYNCKMSCSCGASYGDVDKGIPIGMKGTCKAPGCYNTFNECSSK